MLEILKQPMPWYLAGPLIGLMVPILLILGNKTFGISASLRHICAACIPGKISFFQYKWKEESWNLVLVTGIIIGGFVAATFLMNMNAVNVNPNLAKELSKYGIDNYQSLVPQQIFNWHALLTARGLIMIVGGGFLVGFGTRYAGGCTSGHAIMGLSNLQWPSLIATICFMAGGFFTTNILLPIILNL